MTDINEVLESLRLSITSGNSVPVTRATVKADDLRALLDDHAFLQKAHCDALNGMRRAVVALAYAQQNDPIYLQAYGFLDEAIKQAKAVKK